MTSTGDVSHVRPSICFVAPNAFPLMSGDEETPLIGGAELQQVIVAKALAARGYRVSMICLNFGQPEQVEIDGVVVLRAYRPDEGIRVIRFLWPRITSIWRCMARADADIYYQRAAAMLCGLVAAFCKYYGKVSIFAAAENRDFSPKIVRINLARDRWIHKWGVRHVDKILVQNEEQARLCSAHFGRQSTIIPNCYPAEDIQPVESGRLVLWVATIRQVKRPEAFLDLAEAFPKYAFRMIGGPDSAESKLYESLKRRACSIPNLQFMGFVPYAKTEKHFNEAAVFVNTSDFEGFPNTFLQAWARGIPTVSFVDSGARYRSVPVGRQVDSFEDMKKCLCEWLENESIRRKVGLHYREYVLETHSLQHVMDMYDKLFSDLIMRNKA